MWPCVVKPYPTRIPPFTLDVYRVRMRTGRSGLLPERRADLGGAGMLGCGGGSVVTKKPAASDDPRMALKLKVAQQLGLGEKVRTHGWGGLSARENGSVGGRMTRIRKSDEGAPR